MMIYAKFLQRGARIRLHNGATLADVLRSQVGPIKTVLTVRYLRSGQRAVLSLYNKDRVQLATGETVVRDA